MKCLYWNVRGLANSPTKLALKNLLSLNKPDFCFISEPWLNISRISNSWWNRFGLKVFAVNNRNILLPNLWCLCSTHLTPTLIDVDNQLVSFVVDVSGVIFGTTAVYASTCYLSGRALW
jgi:hypothetical protein